MGSCHDAKGLLETSYLSWHLIDLPGHGKTKQTATLQDLFDYLDELKSPFHLVGYSMGGRVAQKLAHHKNTLSLTLISSQTLFSDAEYLNRIEFEKELTQKLQNLPFKEFVEEFYKSSLFTSLRRRKTLFNAMLTLRQDLDPKDLLYALKELNIEKIISPFPPCPILELYGMCDLKYQKYCNQLPEVVHVVSIAQAGHALCLENPKQSLSLIEKFITRCEHDVANLRTV